MKHIYQVLYYDIDEAGDLKGPLWEVGYFTTIKKAMKYIKVDMGKGKHKSLEKKYKDYKEEAYYYKKHNEKVGIYTVSNIKLNEIRNYILAE